LRWSDPEQGPRIRWSHFADHHAFGLRAGDALHLAIAYNHGLELCSLDKTLVGAAEPLAVSARLL
jgi:uncharacterized protein